MTQPAAPHSSTARHRPPAIVLYSHDDDRTVPSPAPQSGQPFLESYEYQRVQNRSPSPLPSPDFSPAPGPEDVLAGPRQGGQRISNYTVASSVELDATHSRHRSLPTSLRRRQVPSWFSSPPPAALALPPVRSWLWQAGPFEMGRAVGPVVIWWGAYVLDRLMRQPSHHWPLAVGGTVLVTAGCTAQWGTLIEALLPNTAALPAFTPPATGPSRPFVALGVVAPVAQLISGLALFRGRQLASRPLYEGGLWGSVFAAALGHHVGAQLLERLPPWQPTTRSEGAQGPACAMALSLAALVGVVKLGTPWPDWQSLLAVSLLFTSASFLSLREWRFSLGAQSARTTGLLAASAHSLLGRADSGRTTNGGDHFLARRPQAADDYELHRFGSMHGTVF